MWANLQHSVRAIAQEAVETAKELREAHNPEWAREDGSAPPPTTQLPALPNPPQPPAPAPSAAEPERTDVTARLAALKAKLQADKMRASNPSLPVPPPTSSVPAAPAPQQQQPSPPLPHAQTLEGDESQSSQLPALQKELEGAQLQLQRAQLEREEMQQWHKAELERAVQEAIAQQAERHRDELAQVQEQAAAAAAAAAHSAAQVSEEPAEMYDEVHRLRAEAQAAADELAHERSRAASMEAAAEELRVRLERADAAVAALHAREDAESDVERALAEATAESAALREELARVRSELPAAAPSASDRDDSSAAAAAAASTAAIDVAAVHEELASARKALAISDTERSSLKQQLARLKAQMLGEQDDEEDKVKWRVDAEVKLALEKLGVGSGGVPSGIMDRAAESQLRAELAVALDRAVLAEQAAVRWEKTASARDAELSNMQRALGELSFESDAAERLRAELRAMQAEVYNLRNEVDASKVAKMSAEGAVQQAQADAAAARSEAGVAREAEAAAQREVLEARVAQQNAERQLRKLQGDGVLERGMVMQALTGIASLRQPREAVQFAAKTLGFSAEEVAEMMRNSKTKQTSNNNNGVPSLANSWISFLESQAIAEENGGSVATAAPSAAPSLKSGAI